MQLARTFSLTHVAQRCFVLWALSTVARRRKRTLANYASTFYARSLTSACLTEWMRRLHHRMESCALLQACSNIRRQHVLSSAFKTWADSFRDNKLTWQCKNLHNRKLQAQCFALWQVCFEAKQGTRHRAELMLKQRTRRSLIQYFSVWTATVQRRKEIERVYTACTTLHQTNIFQTSWLAWLTALHKRQENQEKARRHVALRTCKLLQTTFSAWTRLPKEAHTHQAQHKVCTAIYSNHLLRRTFGVWMSAHKAQNSLRRTIDLRKEVRKRRVVKSAFTAWVHLSQQRKEVKQKEVLLAATCSLNLLRDAMTAWRRVIQRNLEKDRRRTVWLTFRCNNLTRKTWIKWKTFVVRRRSAGAKNKMVVSTYTARYERMRHGTSRKSLFTIFI